MTTEELIAQLTEIEAKASPGPWLYHHDGLYENGGASMPWRPHGPSAALIVLLKSEALPALKALAVSNRELVETLLQVQNSEAAASIMAGKLAAENAKLVRKKMEAEESAAVWGDAAEDRATRLAEATSLLKRAAGPLYASALGDDIRAWLAPQKEVTP